jgi:cell division transport system ATP-binding protein
VIDLRDVTVSYPLPDGNRRDVFEHLTLSLKQGEMAYLIGPTGSGKTTLMRLIYMDLFPDEGVVRVGEYRSDMIEPKDIPYLRRSLGVVFQDFQLLPDRSVYENVAFALYATGKSGAAVKNRVMQVLGRVGLQHKWKRYPHEISGGEQQRVSIARAIANEPWILLADEPTGNLDPRVADEIQKLLISLHRQGMTLLISTHDYRLVKKFPARTLALMKGQIVDVDAETIGEVARKNRRR